jgi:catechol 2,3-dioxygenase-like lactoylglutathione lyase family enzyme
MITGVHAIIYSPEADAARAFLRDVLGLPNVDTGGGWLIFALPPAELAIHPSDGSVKHELYFLCDDVRATVSELREKGVDVSDDISDQGWGLLTRIRLPGGVEVGLYEPRHALAASAQSGGGAAE